MGYHLILHEDLRAQINALSEERKRNPGGEAAKEYVAVIKGLKALKDGRETDYQGKQLGYGPGSHDLRDCAELKVPVVNEFTPGGFPRGPSHRLTYREFEPLPRVEDGRVVNDPDAMAYRQVVAFAHRRDDPAAITGQRLGRERGMPQREFHGLTGGGRPEVGRQREGGADDAASDSGAAGSDSAGGDSAGQPAGRHTPRAAASASGGARSPVRPRTFPVPGALTPPP
ncbi:hypothetical protein ACXC9Q_33065 [Kribbella sp. CWNU-51]